MPEHTLHALGLHVHVYSTIPEWSAFQLHGQRWTLLVLVDSARWERSRRSHQHSGRGIDLRPGWGREVALEQTPEYCHHRWTTKYTHITVREYFCCNKPGTLPISACGSQVILMREILRTVSWPTVEHTPVYHYSGHDLAIVRRSRRVLNSTQLAS